MIGTILFWGEILHIRHKLNRYFHKVEKITDANSAELITGHRCEALKRHTDVVESSTF